MIQGAWTCIKLRFTTSKRKRKKYLEGVILLEIDNALSGTAEYVPSSGNLRLYLFGKFSNEEIREAFESLAKRRLIQYTEDVRNGIWTAKSIRKVPRKEPNYLRMAAISGLVTAIATAVTAIIALFTLF
ncbi:MAG: hypothetical protein OXH16_15225 [Gemmatimonadetes bacterium]|nr:hypothetical protein [Gemmatimonadota bacterium]